MIEIYTQSNPDKRIEDYKADIFALKQGAYNLPQASNPLFAKLYEIGVRQIIHDGKPDEIRCMDGYLFATKSAFAQEIPSEDLLIIKP